jgi:regulator of ribonuclease activity A
VAPHNAALLEAEPALVEARGLRDDPRAVRVNQLAARILAAAGGKDELDAATSLGDESHAPGTRRAAHGDLHSVDVEQLHGHRIPPPSDGAAPRLRAGATRSPLLHCHSPGMADWNTCDLCDDNPGVIRVPEPGLRHFGGVTRFSGPVMTVRCLEDNTRIKELVNTPGEGRVLIVDGAGRLGTALVGDVVGGEAVANGWAGIIVDGCVRDSAGLAALQLGVMAITTCPQRPARVGQGTAGEDIMFRGVPCRPGDLAYADEDGVVLLPAPR